MPHPRKEAAAERERSKKEATRLDAARRKEDARWEDNDDKARIARDARLAEREQKSEEQFRRQKEKAELIRLEEESCLGRNKKLASVAPKIKQSEIRLSALSHVLVESKKKKVPTPTIYDVELEPNPNKQVQIEEAKTGIKLEAGTGTIGAISALSSALDAKLDDAHPERRMKAMHTAFEERRIKELQTEKPGLKRSQYKEMAWKEWLKSPENPKVALDK